MRKEKHKLELVSREIQPYMVEQINELVEAGRITVIPPKKHKQSTRAFPRGGRGSVWYNQQIKGNK